MRREVTQLPTLLRFVLPRLSLTVSLPTHVSLLAFNHMKQDDMMETNFLH